MSELEIAEVVDTLRSGWLTTGPKVRRFETEFAAAVGAKFAIALNSATAALHLAVEALGLQRGQGVLVPTMTFAATAEVVRYLGGVPILVDCDPVTGNMLVEDAERKIELLRAGRLPESIPADTKVVGIIPVHVGGLILDVEAVKAFAERHGLWIVEDAAHAFPAAWRADASSPWRQCGQESSAVACFSFYANKTITTGEGGMAVTDDHDLADRMRLMSLHGLSHDAWNRYSGGNAWDYRIVAPGFKYNLTDIAAAIGIHQLARAEELRLERERLGTIFRERLGALDAIDLPPIGGPDRIHSWHLFPIRLRLDRLTIDRNEFIQQLRARGVGCSVHWRPLHLHPYYEETFGWSPSLFPGAGEMWPRIITLPLFPGMREEEVDHVLATIAAICAEHAA
ncbi:MAG: DegT/DnrJ/EryC1/StrS family aminotransferase [Thermoanaerobaculia bacterium]